MRIRYVIAGLPLLLVLAIVTAGCMGAQNPSPQANTTGSQIERGNSGGDQLLLPGMQNLSLESARELVLNLTEKENNMTSLQSALETGDLGSMERFFDQFRGEHHEARSSNLSGDRITRTVTNLTASGYDLSTVQEALIHGDADAARTLLEQFAREHPEAELGSRLAELGTAGINISAARTAFDSGDFNRTREYLRNLNPPDRSNDRSPTPTAR